MRDYVQVRRHDGSVVTLPTLGTPPDTAWQDDALCAEVGTELFFPEKGQPTKLAKRICARCPVTRECLDYALMTEPTGARHGVYGGTTPNERAAIHRQTQTGAAA